MSVHGHAASEGAEPGNFYAESGAWAMDPPEPDPIELTPLNDGSEFVYATLDTEENRHHYIAPERVVLLESRR